MDKSKLRPATPADMVKGNKIIVEDVAGVLIESYVVHTLSGYETGDVYVPEPHSIEDAGRARAHVWNFNENDFKGGRHGEYGLKLWVETLAAEDEAPEWGEDVFERAEISKGAEVIRPATGTLTAASREVELENALRDLTGNAELARFHMKDTEEAGILASSLWDTILQARSVLGGEAK